MMKNEKKVWARPMVQSLSVKSITQSGEKAKNFESGKGNAYYFDPNYAGS